MILNITWPRWTVSADPKTKGFGDAKHEVDERMFAVQMDLEDNARIRGDLVCAV